jgi:hypothetical protein
LKVASKFFGQKFACGSSITGDDEIVIQGDFKDDLIDLIPEKWPEVRVNFVHLYSLFFKQFIFRLTRTLLTILVKRKSDNYGINLPSVSLLFHYVINGSTWIGNP